MTPLDLKPIPGLSFLAEEDGKPCHKHMLNGKEVPGCTSVSGLFQDDGWKFAWPVKLMEQRILEEVEKVASGCEEVYRKDLEEILKTAKNAWRVKRDKAADSGTRAHKLIEDYIAGRTIKLTSEDAEVNHCLSEFFKWERIYKPVWLATEVQVGSAKHRFAGILDALAGINGLVTLVDFKTSASIKDDYEIQLGGLCIGLEEMGMVVDRRAILHIPKEGDYEYRIIDTDLERDKEAFLAALNFLSHKNLFMGRHKKWKPKKSVSAKI